MCYNINRSKGQRMINMHTYTQKDVFKNGEFIALRKKKGSYESFVHTHEFAEFSYTFSGSAVHIINGKSYEVKRGTVIYIPIGCTHDIECTSPSSLVEIFVKPEMSTNIFSMIKKENNISDEDFREKCTPYFLSMFKCDDRNRVESIIQDMLLEYNYQVMNYQNVLHNYLHILITLMMRNRLVASQSSKVIPVDVMDYIDTHYARQLKVEELAIRSFYSTKYFSHIFKKSTGVSLTDYIAKKRIDEGCRLLIETDMTIDEISKKLGWENNTQFYNNFKKYCGVTPHTYKKKQR